MRERIQAALAALQPQHLEVLDESHMHHRGEESHFKVVMVSERFDGLNAVKRHQLVYAGLSELMGQFHALALHTYSPGEWTVRGGAPASPTCRGGGLH